MADEQAAKGKPFDPMDAFRDMRDTYLDAWAKTMVDAVIRMPTPKLRGPCLTLISPRHRHFEMRSRRRWCAPSSS